MKKSLKHKKRSNTVKRKTDKRKTVKYHKARGILVNNATPIEVRNISNKIAKKLSIGSYSPTINKELVTFKTTPRKELLDCNMEQAFELKAPLQIGIPNLTFGKKCYEYNTPEATKFLLSNLAANKHIDPTKIVPPIQIQSNCWFNAMFTTFFVSDKGRKFFHFLRQLMIEGKQQDGSTIPDKLRDPFALLNFGVDACLTGNEYAYKLNTNSVIHQIYKAMPESYKKKNPYITDIDEAGNPLLYYSAIISYLHNSSIQMLIIRETNMKWKDTIIENVHRMGHLPHIIVFEIFEEEAAIFNKKPVEFKVNNATYAIDSAVVRDVSKQHFCATLTCEGAEMGYDGMSFHRLGSLKWKDNLNRNIDWKFEGTKDYDGTSLLWNFTKCYQMLIYYRIK
jgi:hypothetical protein